MVASRPPSPPVVAAAVGAVCLVKRKDDEKSFCGADGGTTHHIHTPRAFLRRWIFRVCACSLVLAGRYLLVALLIVDSFCRCCSPSIKTRRRLHPNPNVAHTTHKKFPNQQQRSPPVLRLQMDVGPDESWDSNPSLRPPLEDTLIKTLPNPGSLPRHTCGTSLSRRSDPKCPLRSHTQSVEVYKNGKIGNRKIQQRIYSACM